MINDAIPVPIAGPFALRTRYQDHLMAPYDDTLTPLFAIIDGAKKSLYFIGFDITLHQIADKVEKLVAVNGSDVQGAVDLSQSVNTYEVPLLTRLKAAMGTRLVIGVSPVRHQIIHTKLVIADHKIAWYGSSNLTTAASYESNLVIVQRNKKVIAALEAWFHQVMVDTLAHPS